MPTILVPVHRVPLAENILERSREFQNQLREGFEAHSLCDDVESYEPLFGRLLQGCRSAGSLLYKAKKRCDVEKC